MLNWKWMLDKFYSNPDTLFFQCSANKFLPQNQKPKQAPPYASATESSQPQIKQRRVELNLEDLSGDPGLRSRISEYIPND